jgi:hypothetical protein
VCYTLLTLLLLSLTGSSCNFSLRHLAATLGSPDARASERARESARAACVEEEDTCLRTRRRATDTAAARRIQLPTAAPSAGTRNQHILIEALRKEESKNIFFYVFRKERRRPATGDAELGHEILDDTEEADAREEVLVHELLHASSPKRRPVGVHLGLGFWDQATQ